LIAQSLVNNLVSDWFGNLEIAKCYPWEGESKLYNIQSLLGVKISGVINSQNANLILSAWKSCSFDLQGRTIKMKKVENKNGFTTNLMEINLFF